MHKGTFVSVILRKLAIVQGLKREFSTARLLQLHSLTPINILRNMYT